MQDMTEFEAAFSAIIDDEEIVRRVIRLQELAVAMFGTICDYADELPDEIIGAAEDWYSYLVESAKDL